MDYIISPSILSADFARLGECVRSVELAGAHELHVDVMDGHFVPNLTIGPVVVRSLKKVTSLPLDVHLMVTDPKQWIEPFAQAGASRITFHVEAVSTTEAHELLKKIRALGIKAGLSLNPNTEPSALQPFIDELDHILIMSVFPGFGGQKFIEESYERVRVIRNLIGAHEILLQIDGGINQSRVRPLAEMGVSAFIAGSTIFDAHEPASVVQEFLDIFEELSRD